MAYIEFNAVVKKVNLKADGKKEVILEVSDASLRDQLDSLSELVGCKISNTLESQIVNYSVEINTRTNQPAISYTVDLCGVVKEIEAPKGTQLEADLNLPAEKIKTKEEKRELELDVIDEFITSGLAPMHEKYDMQSIITRKRNGETYMKLSTELEISSGKIVELVDEYRKRVAPLAEKWWEWKEGQENEEKDEQENE